MAMMQWASRKKFMTSTPAILKLLEMAGLVTSLTLFLVSNKCQSIPMFVSLFALPVAVSLVFLLVSYTTAILLTLDGRNPFITPTWAKGESWLNVLAAVVMVMGSTLTLTRRPCSDTGLTVFSLALGYLCAVLFGCSGAVTYLRLVHHQERGAFKIPQQDKEGHIATLAAIF